MTDAPRRISAALSPSAIRNASFTQRRRGLDEAEVRHFLEAMAYDVEAANAERTSLRAEIERLNRLRSGRPEQQDHAEVNARAVAVFSQAQQVADSLVAEAVQHARELVANARDQQRDILEQAHQTARSAAAEQPADARHRPEHGPPADIDYVRTYAQVAHAQLRSVVDALTEQVDKLGELPRLDNQGAASPQERTRQAAPTDHPAWRRDAPRSDGFPFRQT